MSATNKHLKKVNKISDGKFDAATECTATSYLYSISGDKSQIKV